MNDPTFVAYAIAVLVLSANLIGLWGYSGGVRNKTKRVVNPEDAVTVAKGATVDPKDPDTVARVLRAHSNAMATMVPFLGLGLLYVLLGGPALMAQILFGVLVVSRLVHSAVYLAEVQPWRTVVFGVHFLGIVALLGTDVWLMVR